MANSVCQLFLQANSDTDYCFFKANVCVAYFHYYRPNWPYTKISV